MRFHEGKFRPNEGKFRPNEGKFRPNEGKFRPNEGKFRPNEEKFPPNEGKSAKLREIPPNRPPRYRAAGAGRGRTAPIPGGRPPQAPPKPMRCMARMLSHWGRDRSGGPRLPLTQIIKMQTSETADFFGFGDRGRSSLGCAPTST